MKKRIIVFAILILFLSISVVNAGLFGPSRIECTQYSIECPEGFGITEAWESSGSEKDIFLGQVFQLMVKHIDI